MTHLFSKIHVGMTAIRNSDRMGKKYQVLAGNTEGGSITVPLTSCLTGLD